jgi:hypothetical protein
MEIFGGFMVMMSIISLFLAVVWLIMPFVVFAIKGKQDRTLEILEAIEGRLASLEAALQQAEPGVLKENKTGDVGQNSNQTIENRVAEPDITDSENGPKSSSAV